MNKIKLLATGLMLLALTSFTSDNLPKNFTNLLDRAGLTFQYPKGFEEVKIIENRQMNYEFAVKYPKEEFEIRYSIRPLDKQLQDYEEFLKTKKPNDIFINPNELYSSVLQATAMNISGGKLSKFTIFDKDAVKKEFNADWGATTLVEVGEEFGQYYKFCMIVAIHKDNLADAYIFFLADSMEGFEKLTSEVFHSLNFK